MDRPEQLSENWVPIAGLSLRLIRFQGIALTAYPLEGHCRRYVAAFYHFLSRGRKLNSGVPNTVKIHVPYNAQVDKAQRPSDILGILDISISLQKSRRRLRAHLASSEIDSVRKLTCTNVHRNIRAKYPAVSPLAAST